MKCAPGRWVMNTPPDYTQIKRMAHALSDPNRLVIMEAIRKGEDWLNLFEMVPLSQPAVSHHLKILKQASLILSQKTGRKINYTINKNALSSFAQYVTGYIN